MDTNVRSPANGWASKEGDELWEEGTVEIIWMIRKIVKARRRQKPFNSSLYDVFYAPITYG